MTTHHAYMFSGATDEERRLRAQATVFDQLTTRLFAEAGLAPGMRVLDLGSGAGNVAMLAADFVGESGSVVGVDSDPDAIAMARRWADAERRDNIAYREGDVRTLETVDGDFDAVVGRTILTHLSDPESVLRTAVARLRPNGLLCMHELDLRYVWAQPETPLWRQVRSWILDGFAAAGADERMGLSLFSLYRALGLPDARLVVEADAGGGDHSPAFGWANAAAALLPVLERAGIASADEVGADDLEQRLSAELDAHDGFALSPIMVGAWTRLPS